MAHVWADRVAETTTTTGTGALTLAGATTGYQRFSAVCSVNDTVIYAIEAVDGSGVPTGDWELGIGTYSALNTLTRTTVIKSSNANAAVTFAPGTKNVFLDDIASTRNTLQEYVGAQSTNQPSAPTSGSILWAQDRNGWSAAMQRGANGISQPINPLIAGRAEVGWIMAIPDAGTVTAVGMGQASTGSTAIATDTSTAMGAFGLWGFNTTATVSSAATVRSTTAVPFRGTQAQSGFRMWIAGCLYTVGNTNCRWFMGLTNSASALAVTFDPASSASVCIGIGATGTDTTNAKLYYATGSVVNSVDLGSGFPAKTAKGGLFCLELWAAGSSAASVNYRVWRMDDLTVAPVSGTLSSNLPAAALMYAHAHINNNATAAASQIGFMGIYQERGI